MTEPGRSTTEPSELGAQPRPFGRNRRQRFGIALALVGVATVGLLAGAGLSPGDVRESLAQRLFGDPEPDLARARLVASDSTQGASVTVSLAPTDRGPGECIVIATDWRGTTQDGSNGVSNQRVQCRFDGPLAAWADPSFRLTRPSDRFGLLSEAPIGPIGAPDAAVALVGVVFPDVVSITVDFGDGAQYTFNVLSPDGNVLSPDGNVLSSDGNVLSPDGNVLSSDGWFAVILPDRLADIDRLDGTLVNSPVSLKLIDIEGRVLATITPPLLDQPAGD